MSALFLDGMIAAYYAPLRDNCPPARHSSSSSSSSRASARRRARIEAGTYGADPAIRYLAGTVRPDGGRLLLKPRNFPSKCLIASHSEKRSRTAWSENARLSRELVARAERCARWRCDRSAGRFPPIERAEANERATSGNRSAASRCVAIVNHRASARYRAPFQRLVRSKAERIRKKRAELASAVISAGDIPTISP